MKRKKKGSIIKSYALPLDEEKTFDDFEQIAKDNGVSVSELITSIIKQTVAETNTKSPQSKITEFEKGLESQIPSMTSSEEDWKKFYQNLESKEEFKKVDGKLNMILLHHNRKTKKI